MNEETPIRTLGVLVCICESNGYSLMCYVSHRGPASFPSLAASNSRRRAVRAGPAVGISCDDARRRCIGVRCVPSPQSIASSLLLNPRSWRFATQQRLVLPGPCLPLRRCPWQCRILLRCHGPPRAPPYSAKHRGCAPRNRWRRVRHVVAGGGHPYAQEGSRSRARICGNGCCCCIFIASGRHHLPWCEPTLPDISRTLVFAVARGSRLAVSGE